MSELLARGHELNRLRQSIERSLSGHAAVVFVTVEAGSGKSALLDEFRQRAQREHENLAVAIGTCDAQNGTT